MIGRGSETHCSNLTRALALVLGFTLLLSACSKSTSDNTANAKTYLIGTSADFPPMEFRNPDQPDQFSGFEIDMMKAIMGHLGLKYQWKDMKFDGLLPAVQAQQVDMVVSDVYDTSTRQAVVDFVDYIQSGLSVMVAASNGDSVHGYSDLCGKSLGIIAGSPSEQDIANKANTDCKSAGNAGVKIQTFQAVADELPQLDNGRLFAILEDVLSLSYVQSQNTGKYKVVFTDPGVTKSGIVFKKGNTALEKTLQDGFNWYKSSGQYATDATKWGIPASSLI